MKLVNDVVDESTNLISAVLSFAANLIAPEEDEGTVKILLIFLFLLRIYVLLVLF